MAHIYRVIFVCLSLLWVFPTGAAVSQSSQQITQYKSGIGPWSVTAQASCAALGAQSNAASPTNPYPWASYFAPATAARCPSNPNGCALVNTGGGIGCHSVTTQQITSTACPAASTLAANGMCYCNDGYKDGAAGTPDAGKCVADADQAKCLALSGTVESSYNRTYAAGTTSQVCPSLGGGSNCTVDIKWDVTYSVNGVKQQSGIGKHTGKTCSSDTTKNATAPTPPTPVAPPTPGEAGAPAPNSCPAGSYPGTINGVASCVPPSSTEPTTTTTTTTTTTPPPAGSAPGTAPGTTSQTNDTTCVASTCTTTTTTTTVPVGGGTPVVTTSTTEEGRDDFCTENPRSPMCKTSSIGGGSCSTLDVCDGDAIQCAIAARSLQIQCALNPGADGSDADYQAAKANQGNQTANLPGNETIALGAGSFDTSDALGGGACIADKAVVVAGAAITIPFSSICGHLAMLGNLLLSVSFLLAGRIVVRG